jgi:hypothetical protein
MPAVRNEGEGSSPANFEGAQALETLQNGESAEDSTKLFESDYFRMHCMKVSPLPTSIKFTWVVACPPFGFEYR